ncbi:immunoglobulin-like domain-containing protein [endosymbiont 'TC1' of Trimyema compressum]
MGKIQDGLTPKDITSSIVIVSGSVDINTPGTYVIVYKVSH